jgi:hypothetical protein
MTRILRRDKPKLLAVVEQCQDMELSVPMTAELTGMTINQVKSLAWNNGLRGRWPRGAAARDQSGSNNPYFKNGFSKSSVARLTAKVLSEAGRNLYECERCGDRKKIPLPRHHKDRNRKNNSLTNLEVLCVSCHTLEHSSERSRDSVGRFAS